MPPSPPPPPPSLVSALSPADLARYGAGARRREAERLAALERHRARALAVARQAANMLRTSFGARRVVLFGSLARGGAVSWRSDVDLAVWDLPAADYFTAVGRMQALDPAVSVDAVRIEDAPASLRAVIDADGVEL